MQRITEDEIKSMIAAALKAARVNCAAHPAKSRKLSKQPKVKAKVKAKAAEVKAKAAEAKAKAAQAKAEARIKANKDAYELKHKARIAEAQAKADAKQAEAQAKIAERIKANRVRLIETKKGCRQSFLEAYPEGLAVAEAMALRHNYLQQVVKNYADTTYAHLKQIDKVSKIRREALTPIERDNWYDRKPGTKVKLETLTYGGSVTIYHR